MLAWFTVLAVLVTVALLVALVAAAQHQVEAAADLAALSAATHIADGEEQACRAAGRVAASMRAAVTDCRVRGLDVELDVQSIVNLRARRLVLTATARAGPAERIE